MSFNMNKVNMSLDDIINNQRQSKRSLQVVKSKRGPGRGGYQGEGNKFRRRNFGRNDRNENRRDDMRQHRGRGRVRRTERGFRRYNNFDNNDTGKRSRLRDRVNRRRNFRQQNSTNTSNYRRLFVSNLHRDIINSELKNIFSRVGPLKRCGIHWDELGNSRGTADVEYINPDHAKKAIQEFDNAEIDGLAMRVSYSNAGGVRRRIFKRSLGRNLQGNENRRRLGVRRNQNKTRGQNRGRGNLNRNI